jgi:molybdopterin converting factor subunit 1
MRIAVRFFASLRELVGVERLDLDLAGEPTAEDVWRALAVQHPALAARRASLTAAVNRRYARFDEPLHEGDEVAFIPPVSGG